MEDAEKHKAATVVAEAMSDENGAVGFLAWSQTQSKMVWTAMLGEGFAALLLHGSGDAHQAVRNWLWDQGCTWGIGDDGPRSGQWCLVVRREGKVPRGFFSMPTGDVDGEAWARLSCSAQAIEAKVLKNDQR